jgi:uncharacterized protein YegL
MPLKGLAFEEFFTWLSASITLVSQSVEGQTLQLPPSGGWAQISI